MSKKKLLEKAKELNIPRRNCTNTEQKHKKAIKDTIIKYKEIIFGVDSPICLAWLNELWKQHLIDEKVYDKQLIDDALWKLAWNRLQEKNCSRWWHTDRQENRWSARSWSWLY